MAATPFEPNLKIYRNLILVGIPMFSGLRNPLRQVNITLDILVYASLNWRHDIQTVIGFSHISAYQKLIDLILVYIPCFLGQ